MEENNKEPNTDMNLPSGDSQVKVYLPKISKTEKHFSYKQLGIFMIFFAIIGIYFLFKSFAAAPAVATVEAENMSIPSSGSNSSVYVSDLSYVQVANGWGSVEKDRSNGEQGATDGHTITLNGKTYAKGLGTHAYSEVTVPLNSAYSSFKSDIGVDDEIGNQGSVVFQVFADGTKIYDSGVMYGATATKSFTVDVTGKNQLKLIVTNYGDNGNYDHGDWAGAQLFGLNTTTTSAYVSDLSYAQVANGWGPVEKDKSNGEIAAGDGHTITINGKTYTKGLGTHAYSEINVPLNGQYNKFISEVGLDDEIKSKSCSSYASVGFIVYADGIKLFDSGVMKLGTATSTINVDVTGKNQLKLVVNDGGNGNGCDHGDWANPQLTAGSSVSTPIAQIISDTSASGGRAMKLLSNGTISSQLTNTAIASSISVRAKSTVCNSVGANLVVKIDGTQVLAQTVSATSWTDFTATLNLAAGTHALDISYTNEFNDGTCDRNLFVDGTVLYGQVAPPPTVSLAASPGTVSPNGSSTLTWSTVNASSCTASGAWSGTKAISGTESTGALSASSTYTLACTGSGGSGSASTTVTVTSSTTIPAGKILYTEKTAAESDAFTNNPSAADKQWMNDHWYRSIVYGGYWDSRYSWYNKTWTYLDAYAIYNPSTTATQHPDWILKDASGNKLYIPWGCSGGTCPQFAGDIGNPTFRQDYINRAKSEIAKGSGGIFVDDVNLQAVQVGNGNGTLVAPIDPRTGTTMTYDNWRRYFAEFMEQLKTSLPGKEIAHNAVWFAGTANHDATDQYVVRQVKAANVVGKEGGLCDGGMTGGTGVWSIYALFHYVDNIHSYGTHFMMQSYCSTVSEQEYNAAGYLLVNNGGDTVSAGAAPGIRSNWWPGYDMNLGDATGARTRDTSGLYRRDFSQGLVLLVEPGAATRTINLGGTYYNAYGQAVTSVTLGAKQAVVLRK